MLSLFGLDDGKKKEKWRDGFRNILLCDVQSALKELLAISQTQTTTDTTNNSHYDVYDHSDDDDDHDDDDDDGDNDNDTLSSMSHHHSYTDGEVLKFCQAVERCMVCGLRGPFHKKSFWDVVKLKAQTTTDRLFCNDVRFVNSMTALSFDLRPRAWIRLQLNGQRLGHSIRIIGNDRVFLADEYKDWALMRRPHMVAELARLCDYLSAYCFELHLSMPSVLGDYEWKLCSPDDHPRAARKVWVVANSSKVDPNRRVHKPPLLQQKRLPIRFPAHRGAPPKSGGKHTIEKKDLSETLTFAQYMSRIHENNSNNNASNHKITVVNSSEENETQVESDEQSSQVLPPVIHTAKKTRPRKARLVSVDEYTTDNTIVEKRKSPVRVGSVGEGTLVASMKEPQVVIRDEEVNESVCDTTLDDVAREEQPTGDDVPQASQSKPVDEMVMLNEDDKDVGGVKSSDEDSNSNEDEIATSAIEDNNVVIVNRENEERSSDDYEHTQEKEELVVPSIEQPSLFEQRNNDSPVVEHQAPETGGVEEEQEQHERGNEQVQTFRDVVPTIDELLSKLIVNAPQIRSTDVLLRVQNKRCFTCDRPFPHKSGLFSSSIQANFCHYTGYLHCKQCMGSKNATIPALVLSDLNTTVYPVCSRAYEYLSMSFEVPNLSVKHLSVLSRVEATHPLRVARFFRHKMKHIRPFIMTCRQSSALLNRIGDYDYMMDSIWIYSMKDLLDLLTGDLCQRLQTMTRQLEAHITEEDCAMCFSKAFYCEVCKSDEPIFSFQIQTVRQCKGCLSFFHRNCRGSTCPKCERISKRHGSVPNVGIGQRQNGVT